MNYSKHITKHIQQNSKGCGQACVAMILDLDLKTVDKLIKTSVTTSINKIIEIMKAQGYPDSKFNSITENPQLPKFGIAFIKSDEDSYENLNTEGSEAVLHATIIDEDKLIDPNNPNLKFSLKEDVLKGFTMVGYIELKKKVITLRNRIRKIFEIK